MANINFDLSTVIIYLEYLPEKIFIELKDILNEISALKDKNSVIDIKKEDLTSEDISKYPEAQSKLVIFGNCSDWTEQYRKIIRAVRKHTVCVIIE